MVEYEHQTGYRMLKRGDIGLPSEIIANSIYWKLDLSVFGTPSNLRLSLEHITILSEVRILSIKSPPVLSPVFSIMFD
jgi:hypothetical protein